MARSPLLFLFLLATLFAGAQTKKIAFESHSGSASNFTVAVTDEFFEADHSDFGLPANKEVTRYRLDTVKRLNDTTVVFYTTKFTGLFTDPVDSLKISGNRIDTLVNDPVYSGKLSADSIRRLLKEGNNYLNTDKKRKVVIIGFDTKKKQQRQELALPVSPKISPPGDQPPSAAVPAASQYDTEALQILLCILLAALLATWLSLQWHRNRIQKA